MQNKFLSEEALLEQGQKTVKSISDQLQAAKNTAGQQIMGGATDASANPNKSQDQEFIKDLYGASQNTNQPASTTNNSQQSGAPTPVSDEQKLMQARKLLDAQHKKEYFDPTFNAPKKEEKLADEQEREEREKQVKKMEDLEKEEKKKIIKPQKGPEKAPGAG
jgi:hypothetical protein